MTLVDPGVFYRASGSLDEADAVLGPEGVRHESVGLRIVRPRAVDTEAVLVLAGLEHHEGLEGAFAVRLHGSFGELPVVERAAEVDFRRLRRCYCEGDPLLAIRCHLCRSFWGRTPLRVKLASLAAFVTEPSVSDQRPYHWTVPPEAGIAYRQPEDL